jgi:hypothetical protein
MNFMDAMEERISYVKLGKDIWSLIFKFVVRMQDTSYFVDFRKFDLMYNTLSDYYGHRDEDGCMYDIYDDDNIAARKLYQDEYVRMKKEYTDVFTFRLICRFTNKIACSKLRFSINPDFYMYTFHHRARYIYELEKVQLETPIRHYPQFQKPTKNIDCNPQPLISTSYRNSHTKTKIYKKQNVHKKRIRRRGYVSNEFFVSATRTHLMSLPRRPILLRLSGMSFDVQIVNDKLPITTVLPIFKSRNLSATLTSKYGIIFESLE